MNESSTKESEGGARNVPDVSAEERFYNRSKRIRRKVRAWLGEHVGETFPSFDAMAEEAANYSGCAAPTSRRWIKQFSARNGDFVISDKEGGLVVGNRSQEEVAPRA